MSAAVRQHLQPGDPNWNIVADTFMACGYWLWYTPFESHAIPFIQEALTLRDRELAPGHPKSNETLSMLVGMLTRAGRAEEAEQQIRDAVIRLRQLFPPENFQLAFAESMLGDNLVALGKYQEAESFLLKSHKVILDTVEDPTNFYAVDSYQRLLTLYDSWGRPTLAEPFREQLLTINVTAKFLSPWPLLMVLFGPEQQALAKTVDAIHRAVGGLVFH